MSSRSSRQPSGVVYGIGVGPGDPGLLTLRAAEILRSVGTVVAPKAAPGKPSLALRIVERHLKPDCRVVEEFLPMNEDAAERRAAWRRTAEVLVEAAADGDVAYITIGDAMLYSTWIYVMGEIKDICPAAVVRAIPGVPAMAACAAAAGTPLAAGRKPLVVIPGKPPASIGEIFHFADNVVFMKAAPHLEDIQAAATTAGLELVAVSDCGLPGEVVSRDLRALGGTYFTTVLASRPSNAADGG